MNDFNANPNIARIRETLEAIVETASLPAETALDAKKRISLMRFLAEAGIHIIDGEEGEV